jgi:hypothetical protein
MEKITLKKIKTIYNLRITSYYVLGFPKQLQPLMFEPFPIGVTKITRSLGAGGKGGNKHLMVEVVEAVESMPEKTQR